MCLKDLTLRRSLARQCRRSTLLPSSVNQWWTLTLRRSLALLSKTLILWQSLACLKVRHRWRLGSGRLRKGLAALPWER